MSLKYYQLVSLQFAIEANTPLEAKEMLENLLTGLKEEVFDWRESPTDDMFHTIGPLDQYDCNKGDIFSFADHNEQRAKHGRPAISFEEWLEANGRTTKAKTCYLAVWGSFEAAPNYYKHATAIVTPDDISIGNGYDPDDISGVRSLAIGDSYKCVYGNHFIVRIPFEAKDIIKTKLTPQIISALEVLPETQKQ